jgi:hypothetical protein
MDHEGPQNPVGQNLTVGRRLPMSFMNSLDALVSQVVQYKYVPPTTNDGPYPQRIKLIASLTLFVRWLLVGPLFRGVWAHWLNALGLVPCTKDSNGQGECKVCDLIDEALRLGRESKIVNRYARKRFTLAYAHVFSHEGGDKKRTVSDGRPALLIAEKDMQYAFMSLLKSRDPKELEMAFDPSNKGSQWIISDQGKVMRLDDEDLKTMPDLPEDAQPLSEVYFKDGDEVSEQTLGLARDIILKPVKSKTPEPECDSLVS